MQFLHKKGQFQGGVRCDTIMLVKGAINEVDFTDWSSHCELGSSRFTVHAKPYYGKLATAEATPAAMLTLCDYTRRSLYKARSYIIKWRGRAQDHRRHDVEDLSGMAVSTRVA